MHYISLKDGKYVIYSVSYACYENLKTIEQTQVNTYKVTHQLNSE